MRPALFVLALAVGCGGTGARDARTLRAELAPAMDASRERAAPLVASVERALMDAESAEAALDVTAAAEHRARARLLSAQAEAVAATVAEDEGRAAIEAETATTLEEALALEGEAETLEGEAQRLAAARAAREEALRALARAEVDEARGRRAIHLSMDDAAAMRGAARDLRQRAQLLLAAAVAIAARNGASLEPVRAEAERLLAASAAAAEPLSMLRQADAAHDAARAALGLARRGAPVSAEQLASLLEACASEGFAPVQLERGVAIDVSETVASGRAPSREGAARLGRLGALVVSYPAGPVVIEVSASGALAEARAEAISAALVGAGVGPERIELRPTSAERDVARVLLSAYAAPTPATASRLLGEPPADEGAAVEAHPTPAMGDE